MFKVEDWGLIDYEKAWNLQNRLVKEIQMKRDRSVLVLCEHPSVITIGRNGSESNIVCHSGLLESAGIDVIHNNRGGDITLHNPGQLVVYPIFNLSDYREDLHWFLRQLEDVVIQLIAKYGITGGRVDGLTGVWVEDSRKICAMGLHCSRWVTSHGLALNVNNKIEEFSYIVPCGINDRGITSISKEIGTPVDMKTLKEEIVEIFEFFF